MKFGHGMRQERERERETLIKKLTLSKCVDANDEEMRDGTTSPMEHHQLAACVDNNFFF